jgi:molybdopterin converting factor small subunit
LRKHVRIKVSFYSYFKELAGCAETVLDLPAGANLGELLARLHGCFPALAPMAKSTLVAVGVEYQDRTYRLQEGDEVSLFPPVQGG